MLHHQYYSTFNPITTATTYINTTLILLLPTASILTLVKILHNVPITSTGKQSIIIFAIHGHAKPCDKPFNIHNIPKYDTFSLDSDAIHILTTVDTNKALANNIFDGILSLRIPPINLLKPNINV